MRRHAHRPAYPPAVRSGCEKRSPWSDRLDYTRVIAFTRRIFVYTWASPTTAIGLVFLPLALLSRGGVQIVDGVLELHGGVVAWFLQHCTLLRGGASAMTLGHVVLGRTRHLLAATRTHERVHVRQCERWGPLFIPAYIIACLIAWSRGKRAYLDNAFEREAYGHPM
jgi:hypothetical protein